MGRAPFRTPGSHRCVPDIPQPPPHVSPFDRYIDQSYRMAKAGRWPEVLSGWEELPLLARRCSRFQKQTSGWTFLHQAAFFGHEQGCSELIRLGADAAIIAKDHQSAADIARKQGHSALAERLQRATLKKDSLWQPSADPDLLPSSPLWDEAVACRADTIRIVVYAGTAVKIPVGARYYVDSFGRTLVGWHGTYDPPRGMGAESMF